MIRLRDVVATGGDGDPSALQVVAAVSGGRKSLVRDVTGRPSAAHSSPTDLSGRRIGVCDMSDVVVAAVVAVAGNLLALLGAWVQVRGKVQLERSRWEARRDTTRQLPPGSRIIENQHGTTIEVGHRQGEVRKEGSRA